MNAFLTIAIIMTVLTGVAIGAFLKISLAISREDKRHSLPFDASSSSERTARALVGVNGSRWD